nr:condensation domain-containing protein [Streptomyces sp. DSM 41633]
FKTRADEHFLLACCHHIVVDGTGIALVGARLASVYSAVLTGAPIPGAIFGSLSDLVDGESDYEASGDYLDDQAYWDGHLPPASDPQYGSTDATDVQDVNWPSAAVQLDSDLLRSVDKLAHSLNVPRSSVVTAACALLV